MGEGMKLTITSLGGNKPNASQDRELSFPNIPNPETRAHVESVVGSNPARYLARGAAQIGAGIAGTPGNIASLGAGIINAAQGLATGREIPGHKTLQKYLPTSENIIKGAEAVTGANLGGGEKANALDRFFSGSASLASGGLSLGRAAKIAAGSQAARLSAKALGAGETGQALAEIGGALGTERFTKSLVNIGKSIAKGEKVSSGVRHNLEKVIRPELYREAEKGLPKNASGDATKVYEFFKSLTPKTGGVPTETKKILRKTLEPVENYIDKHAGRLDIRNAIQAKQDINERLGELLQSHKSPKKAIATLKQAVGTLNEFIQESTQQTHPEFWSNWNSAESLSRGLASGGKQAKALKDEIVGFIKRGSFSGVLGYLAKGTIGGIAGTAIAEGIKEGAKRSKPFFKLISKSPIARREYQKALGALAIENFPLAAQSFARLNEVAEEAEVPKAAKLTITSLGH